jgi:hypothetical protein
MIAHTITAHHWCANLLTIVQKHYLAPTLKPYTVEFIDINQMVHLLQGTSHYLVPLVQR